MVLPFASCYKVVRIPVFDDDEPPKKFNVDVFSSDSGVWMSNQVSCDENVTWDWSNFHKVVLLDGVLYWIEGRHRMLVYNLNQNSTSDGHRCSVINLPVNEFESNYSYSSSILGESQGWVSCARTRWTEMEMVVSVWVLDELNWQLMHKDVSVHGTIAELCSLTGDQVAERYQVLGFSPLDHNVVLVGWKDRVWGINMQTRSVGKLCLGNRRFSDAALMYLPFVLKPMPTILPPPSWIDAK